MTNFHPGYMTQGQPLGMTRKEVNLIADATRIDCGNVSLLKLSSNSTTATDRTFIINASSLVGHELTLLFVSGSSNTCELADSGTVKLQSSWTPLQYDTLTLVSDGTYWVETGRAVATGTPEIPLAAGSILVGDSGGFAAPVAVQYYVKYAGTFTTVGGDATESITVTGATASDIAFVVLRTVGGTPRTVITSIAATNAITVTMSGDPSTDHVLAYQVLRAST